MRKNQGFTLIEVMVALGIIGIIAAIAYPSYTQSIRKSNRMEAKTELVDVAQRLQRCYSTYGRFNDPDDKDRCSVYEQLEEGDKKITTRGSGYYEIKLTNPGTTTYTLTAKAVKVPQTKDDECAEFSLDQAGKKLVKDTSGNDKTSVCW